MTEQDLKRHFDYIVLGAGIAGICAALNIQKRGADVLLIDSQPPGSGASFGNASILVNTGVRPVFAGLDPATLFAMLRNPASPLNVRWSRFPVMAPWFLRMLRHAGPAEAERITRALSCLCQPGVRLYKELLDAAGASDLVQNKGSVALTRSEEERDAHWDKTQLLRDIGVRMQKVSRSDLDDLVPSVSKGYSHGVFSPDFQHALDTQGVVTKFFDLFRSRGGTFLSARAKEVVFKNNIAAGVLTEAGIFAGGKILIAAGTDSARFAAAAGERVPHQAVGGYHIMLQKPGLSLDRPILPIDFRFAITPMKHAIRLAGIYEFGGEGKPFKHSLINDMLAHIGRVLPGVQVQERSLWRGFRSYLPDGLPIISASVRKEGLYYMFGFSSAGMINGATSGVLIADIMTGTKSEIDAKPYSITRFH